MNAHTGILIIAALHTGDYIYGFFLAVAILIWLAATVLYIDKKMRERRWRKRDQARPGYIDWTTLASYNKNGTVITRSMHDVPSAIVSAELSE